MLRVNRVSQALNNEAKFPNEKEKQISKEGYTLLKIAFASV